MSKRIGALIFIFGCTSLAWMFLGSTIDSRTNSSDSKLQSKVASTWGTAQEQCPPNAAYRREEERKVPIEEKGKVVYHSETVVHSGSLPLEASRIAVNLHLDHRQKGLLWYSTYAVAFDGTYQFRSPSDHDERVTFQLPFPAASAIYDDLVTEVDGVSIQPTTEGNAVLVQAAVKAGQPATFRVSYKSQGLDAWRYKLGDTVAQARNFSLQMTTNFRDIDFADNTLSPTEKRPIAGGWELHWDYKNLVSGFAIGMTMPEKLQPGPLAGQISYFAPVSLLFFFFVMFVITTIKNIDLHPMNYFFLATAFFAFHLLLAYLVDHISIHLAFVICSAVSIFLVVSYLRLVVGMRFALVEAGVTQFLYLVLFSYAFFFKGFTGLAVTIGAIASLFVVMQVTGRIKWSEKFDGQMLPVQSRP